MKTNRSIGEVLASLEAATLHREREAFHAEHEGRHRERRTAHAAELEEILRRLEAFRSAAAEALRRLERKGIVHLVRKGRPQSEALYAREALESGQTTE